MPEAPDYPPLARRLATFGALCALVAGTAGVWGWIAALVGWVPWGAGLRMPALSSALGFLGLGFGVLLEARGRRVHAGLLLGVALLVVLFLAASLAGRPLDLEHPGLVLPPDNPNLGHMTHTTAFGLLVGASALWGLGLEGRGAEFLARIGSLGLLLLAVLLTLAHLVGLPAILGPDFLHSSALGSAGLLGLGIGIGSLDLGRWEEGDRLEHRSRMRLTVVGIALCCAIFGGTFLVYRRMEHQKREEVARELAAIAELKADGLQRYRRERWLDAHYLAESQLLPPLVDALFHGRRTPEGEAALQAWLGSYVQGGEYDLVRLVDVQGRVRYQMPGGPPLSATLRRALEVCLRERRVVFQDFYRSENDQQVRLALLVPVATPGQAPLGAVVLRVDPEHRVLPSLRRWPVPTRTGQVVLARREGAELVFIAPPSSMMHGGLMYRRTLVSGSRHPLDQSAMGQKGTIHGLDWQGARQVAHVQPIPGTPWIVAVGLKASEVDGALRQRLWELLLLDALLGAVVVSSLVVLWRQQRLRLLDERLRREQERRRFEAQLARSQKMESLGSLAGGVAHDMNNVLGAILGLASAHVSLQPEGTPVRKAFETIEQAARRGGAMVRGLLDFTRQGLAEERDLDFNTLVQEEVALLAHTTLARVDLRTELAPDLPKVRGDAAALTHVLMNLCVNAVDAMPEGGTLTLRTARGPEGTVEVTVADTGTGMAPEVREKALEPFFTTKPQGKGTGLGLSIVYGTVKAHRGQLHLESAPGQGTTVRLVFPAAAPQAPAAVDAVPVPAAGAARRILLVDDDPLVRAGTESMLSVLGHEVVSLASGEAALAHLEGGAAVDVVIMDLNMPGLGGAGTLPLLKAQRPDLPVLLATGRVDQAATDLTSAHPGVTLVAKPYTLDELRDRLGAT